MRWLTTRPVALALALWAAVPLTAGAASPAPPGIGTPGNGVTSNGVTSNGTTGAGARPAVAGDVVREVGLSVRTSDGLRLAATLRVPPGGHVGGPAMVLVHGAGPGPREKYRQEAEAFARAGIATLAYDKRTVGYSLTERSYSRLADDALAAADVLRAQPGIDPAEVGLWGHSEGGWVAPLAASRDPRTAFLVVVGANGVSPLRQQAWAEALKMQAAGVRGSLVDAASSGVYRLLDSMGAFPEPRYDPVPVLRRLTLPVLGIWGALDRATPPVEAAAIYRTELDRAGNTHYTLRTFAGAEHSLRTTVDGFAKGPDFAPGYVELVAGWAASAAAGRAAPSSVSGAGDQPRATTDVPPLPWYVSAAGQAAALVLMLVGFGGAGLVSAVRRVARGRPGARWAWAVRAGPPALVAPRVLTVTGALTVLGTPAYLLRLTMVRGGRTIDPGPLLAGRTLPWLALHLLAAATLVAGVLLVVRLVRLRQRPSGPDAPEPAEYPVGERIRLALLLVAMAVFVPWALFWGLLLP